MNHAFKTKPQGVNLMIHNKLSYKIETKNIATCKLFLQKSIERTQNERKL